MKLTRAGTAVVVASFSVIGSSCGNTSVAASAAMTLRRAAGATANARSFTSRLAGAEVVYQAPDRVEQIEHGQASTASGGTNGTASTSGPFPATITKVFINQRHYEASGPTGQAEPFSVFARCPGETNAGEYVLGILRAIATSGDIHASGNGYAFKIPKGGSVPFPIDGLATVASGFVDSISVSQSSAVPAAITISAVNTAPSVTAPSSATETHVTCGPAGTSGSSSGAAGMSSVSTTP